MRVVLADAFGRGVPVVPVLVDGARLPQSDELPGELQPLALLHGVTLTDEHWAVAVEVLIGALRALTGAVLAQRWHEWHVQASEPASFDIGPEPLRHVKPGPVLDLRRLRSATQVEVTFDGVGPEAADLVDCSVFAPPQVRAGGQAMVQVFVHLLDHTEEVAALAGEADVDAGRRAVRTLADRISLDTMLTFDLAMAPLVVAEPVDSVVWRGRPQAVQFQVEVPTNCPTGAVVGRVGVSQNTVPVGHILFCLNVVDRDQAAQAATTLVGDQVVRYRSAFASYCSVDRSEVVKRLQGYTPWASQCSRTSTWTRESDGTRGCTSRSTIATSSCSFGPAPPEDRGGSGGRLATR